ncbi:MAG: glycosyl hydrolase 53 family protein [Candidatus Heimdallarchaeota archaeon]|nr:glycosyl hydrolase 53 family protein [Candidatus Heimdallarchaeota archaeon]
MRRANLHAEETQIAIIFAITVVIGIIAFLLNNILGILNVLVYFIQVFFGLIFGLWYIRIFISYLREVRKKDVRKRLGIPKGWVIFGLIVTVFNFIFWFLLSSLLFNFPKMIFLVPSLLAFVQICHTFAKARRRKAKDWFILLYNIFALLYLLNWSLVDFGADLPSILGIFSHTINTNAMWWQILFVNTNAFFSPIFVFPPYMLNPRYYFALPVEEYYLYHKEKKPLFEFEDLTEPIIKRSYTKKGLRTKESFLPGDRKPFFEERKAQEEYAKELELIRKELQKTPVDEDTKYAEFVGSSDFPFQLRKFVNGLDKTLRSLSVGIILVLIILTPLSFAGVVSLNALPKYSQQPFTSKPGMILATTGSVFSTFDATGNISSNWSEKLDEEISLAKELSATHLRYDISSTALTNQYSKNAIIQGVQRIKSAGLRVIINIDAQFSSTKQALFDLFANTSREIASTLKPDYLIIFNEINGKLLSLTAEKIEKEELFNVLKNTSEIIKAESPTTKVMTTVLALKRGTELFQELLTNNSIAIDVVGVVFYPVLFNWRDNLLFNYGILYNSANTTKAFWVSEIGVSSFNFGESGQAKYLANILSLSSRSSVLNVSGICISSLIDNAGISIENGVIKHLGLVYYSGKKKHAFESVSFAFKKIRGLI